MIEEINDILRAELKSLARGAPSPWCPPHHRRGYSQLLRQEHIAYSGVRTVRAIPEAGSTNDLDIFRSVEIVTNAAKMGALRDVLRDSGYTPIPGALHYQFQKAVTYRGTQRNVKVDLLAPPPRDPGVLDKVRIDVRRIRHREARGIHAHTTPEAFFIEEGVLPLVAVQHPLELRRAGLQAPSDGRQPRTHLLHALCRGAESTILWMPHRSLTPMAAKKVSELLELPTKTAQVPRL